MKLCCTVAVVVVFLLRGFVVVLLFRGRGGGALKKYKVLVQNIYTLSEKSFVS